MYEMALGAGHVHLVAVTEVTWLRRKARKQGTTNSGSVIRGQQQGKTLGREESMGSGGVG